MFNLVGAGRLGKSLAHALVQHQVASLNQLCSQQISHAEQTIKIIGAGTAVAKVAELASAPITFITVPDDRIAAVAAQLTQIQPGDCIIHCSGVLSSDILAPLVKQGAHIASFHPLKAFGAQQLDADCFNQCDCVVEGDAQAIAQLEGLFKPLGARFISLDRRHKAIYHSAAVLASNYLITLAAHAQQLFAAAAIDPIIAKAMVERLMQSNLDNIKQTQNISDALTGPLARGDKATIVQHLDALAPTGSLALYQAAALATLPLTKLNSQQLLEFKALFT